MKTMSCSIFTADNRGQFDSVFHVTVPSVSGTTDVYPDCAESYMLLEEGDIEIYKDASDEPLVVHVVDGGCFFRDQHLTIFVAS